MARFDRPHDNQAKVDNFGLNEVGLNHRETPAYFRFRDNGDVELVMNDEVAIIMSASTNSITLVCDELRILTKDGDSIRWNNKRFNSAATNYTQPALFEVDTDTQAMLYGEAEQYYDD